ncbi:MAG: CRISPR-associated protein [Bacillota bacterium]|nr:MAG: CRISPR-associated protein [Bacillota bacterium]
MAEVRSGELLFVKSVKDGIPNRDPLNDSDARRLFDEEDGRISLSDVSIKRDVRDYVLARYPDGGDGTKHVYVREARSAEGNLLGRRALAEQVLGISPDKAREELPRKAFDVRAFGVVYSVSKVSFHLTGPVQFGWAHSLHPVESRYVQGTVVMAAEDDRAKGQGTIWTTYIVPFAVFAMHGIINAALAKETGLTPDDVDLVLEGLWKGTRFRQARGRGIQEPLFLLHVEYNDPFFRIGDLDRLVHLEPGREAWLKPGKPSSVAEVALDVQALGQQLLQFQDRVARVRYWLNPAFRLEGDAGLRELGGEPQPAM